jgi:cytochrome d ubiquinol oxidase subunit I
LVSGDISARATARLQPAKLAAMEAHYHTGTGAPLIIGGIPDSASQTTAYGLHIPSGLSLLVAHDPGARVVGLDQFPRADWPNVRIVHWAFDLMVGCGSALLGLSAWASWLGWKHRRLPDGKWLLLALVAAGPLGFVAIEAGWVVTEVGRQPWIIYGVLRTAEAVTPMPGLVVPFATFTLTYLFLAFIVVHLLLRQFLETRAPAPTPEAGHA